MQDIKNKGQIERNRRWIDKNKEHKRYLTSRSESRSFIRNRATIEDLEELKALIEAKEIELLGFSKGDN